MSARPRCFPSMFNAQCAECESRPIESHHAFENPFKKIKKKINKVCRESSTPTSEISLKMVDRRLESIIDLH